MARKTAGHEAALDRRQWGEGNTDVRNWMVDHGQAPPRSPREARDHARSVAAGARLKKQQAERERETGQQAEQRRPGGSDRLRQFWQNIGG
jgi:hypothetical protein